MTIAPPPPKRSLWHSKSTGAYVAHVMVAASSLTGAILDWSHNGAKGVATIIGAQLFSHTGIAGVHTGFTSRTEVAQANSPEWPETQAQVQARMASIQPVAGAGPETIHPPTGPTAPAQGIHVDLSDIH